MLFEDSKGFLCRTMIVFIIIGIALRLIVGTLMSYNYDVFSWTLIISNIQGGSGLYDVTGYNYPPVWGHFLAILGQFTDMLGIDVLAERFPELIFTESEIANNPHLAFTTTLEFNALFSVMIAAFDIVTAYLIYYATKTILKDERKGLLASAFWMLCPFAIIVGTIGPMFDTMSGALVILMMLLLIKDHEFLAGCIFSISILLKLFPGFLLFIFIAYIIVKHRDDFIRRIGSAAMGAVMMIAIIMLPQILDGHVIDSLSFITNRATTSNAGFGILDSLMPILTYIVAIIIEIALGFFFYKKEHTDLDRDFLLFVTAGAMVTLLFPGTPQYILIGAPLITIMAFAVDFRFKAALILFIFGTSMYVLADGASMFTSLMEYSDLLPYDVWYGLDDWMMGTEVAGLNMYRTFAFIGSFIQYLGVLTSYFLLAERLGWIQCILDRIQQRKSERMDDAPQ